MMRTMVNRMGLLTYAGSPRMARRLRSVQSLVGITTPAHAMKVGRMRTISSVSPQEQKIRRQLEPMSFDQRREVAPRSNTENEDGSKKRSSLQDVGGTRVFVEGLPTDAGWQDVKDHFRIAGKVLFATVGRDSRTGGGSKKCGVVQFDTAEMAENAIRIMRDNPLNGHTLDVRRDVQERDGGARQVRNPMPRSGKRPTIAGTWTFAAESATEILTKKEKSAILSLIGARDEARERRDYVAADSRREELKSNHGVFVDDRRKMWWVSPNDRKVPTSISETDVDGGRVLPPWRQIRTIPDNDACVNPDLVNALLTKRDIARREKDFVTADALLEKAKTSPDGDTMCIRIHDESRTWRIWTETPPKKPLPSFTPTTKKVDDFDTTDLPGKAITTSVANMHKTNDEQKRD